MILLSVDFRFFSEHHKYTSAMPKRSSQHTHLLNLNKIQQDMAQQQHEEHNEKINYVFNLLAKETESFDLQISPKKTSTNFSLTNVINCLTKFPILHRCFTTLVGMEDNLALTRALPGFLATIRTNRTYKFTQFARWMGIILWVGGPVSWLLQ